jgi:predicted kinase
MYLLIIQGATSTGKTTLASRLSNELGIPVLLRDKYKESAYDAIQKVPNLWRWLKIEQASWRELYQAVQTAKKADQSLIVESNFTTKRKRELQKLLTHNVNVIEIYCFANGVAILDRFKKRHKSGERHRSHRDNLWAPVVWLEVTCDRLGWHWVKPLQLSEHFLPVDTSDFLALDYPAIIRFIADSTA